MTKLSAYEIAERAANARAALNDPTLTDALDQIQQEYVRELIQTDVGGLTAVQLHANIRAVENLRARLQSMINDEKFLARKGK